MRTSSDVASAISAPRLIADAALDPVPEVRLARPGQRPTVELDLGHAGDDVVLHPGGDDVRADGVAGERPSGAGVHRVAGRVECRVAGGGVRTEQPSNHLAGRPVGLGRETLEECRHDRRDPSRLGSRQLGHDRGGPDRGVVRSRHRAVAPRATDRDPVDGEALLGHLDGVEATAAELDRDAATLVERARGAKPLGPLFDDPAGPLEAAGLLVGGRGEQDVAAETRDRVRTPDRGLPPGPLSPAAGRPPAPWRPCPSCPRRRDPRRSHPPHRRRRDRASTRPPGRGRRRCATGGATARRRCRRRAAARRSSLGQGTARRPRAGVRRRRGPPRGSGPRGSRRPAG